MDSTELNDKQRHFVLEYMLDFNGAQAAIRAGYSPKSAKVTASRLLTNANVKKYLTVLQTKKRHQWSEEVDQVFSDLFCIASSNLIDYLDEDDFGMRVKSIDSIPCAERVAIKRYHRDVGKFLLHDKMRAIEAIMRRLVVDQDENRSQLPDDSDAPDFFGVQERHQ